MIYHNQNDETLVLLTLAGKKEAYESLVVRYQQAAIKEAVFITKNRHLAEDAAQDAFVSGWIKLDKLREPSKFGSWILQIVRNCAVNTVRNMRSFLPVEMAENTEIFCVPENDPAQIYALQEKRDELKRNIQKLPCRVKEIICLHYFEDLSVVQIAERLGISEGTVKWQLHDGRKRIRKDLCAMNEEYNDTLLQKVMKKVQELKLWQYKNSKTGFENVYEEVLKNVEELCDSKEKHHALADVLVRGLWWIPGKKNDGLFERIKSSAIVGKNEEVMEYIVLCEDRKMRGYDPGSKAALIEFRKTKQIPFLEKHGFSKALGMEWFALGYDYYITGEKEKATEAFDKVRQILSPRDCYYALVSPTTELLKRYDEYTEKSENSYCINAGVNEFRYVNRELLSHEIKGRGEGYLNSADTMVCDILTNASRCDGKMFDTTLSAGEKYLATDGATLLFAEDNLCVKTPAGVFENCQKWTTEISTDYESSVYTAYFKEGVGIVKFERCENGFYDSRLLCEYKVVSGNGIFPCGVGNFWDYSDEYAPNTVISKTRFEVAYSDDVSVLISSLTSVERVGYDENSWQDMIGEIRNEYYTVEKNGNERLCDVRYACDRAEQLAKTRMQKAHTKAACSVARRIMDTDETLNPGCTATGHWNFFGTSRVLEGDGRIKLSSNHRWAFEWKCTGEGGDAETPLLFNNIYGILCDGTGFLWNDDWQEKESINFAHLLWDTHNIETKIRISKGHRVVAKSGEFDDCLKLSLDVSGFEGGLAYLGGHKEYYFAKGIGIVRYENEYCEGIKTAVYELTYFEGVGEGYMPVADGLVRRYEAQGLTDGYVAGAEYIYVSDDDGKVTIFSDRKGIRVLPPPITLYSSIQNEVIEEKLWREKKHDESRARHDANNFHLLAHFLTRPTRYWARPEKAVAWNKYRLKTIEGLSEDGKVPEGLEGFYTMTAFRTACALFGVGKNEEGYKYLDIAFEYAEKWTKHEDGELLCVGDPLIFGGVKIAKNKEILALPDGTCETLTYGFVFVFEPRLIHYGLTAPHGWEWFNGVRNEKRYAEYVEKAWKLMEKDKKH